MRRFAALVGVSSSYISKVEQGNTIPPTIDRVKRMADILGENHDDWIALAGRVPDELTDIILIQTEVVDLLRTVKGMTVEQLRRLRVSAERMKETE